MYNMNIHLHPCMTTVQNYAQTSVKKIQRDFFQKNVYENHKHKIKKQLFQPFFMCRVPGLIWSKMMTAEIVFLMYESCSKAYQYHIFYQKHFNKF